MAQYRKQTTKTAFLPDNYNTRFPVSPCFWFGGFPKFMVNFPVGIASVPWSFPMRDDHLWWQWWTIAVLKWRMMRMKDLFGPCWKMLQVFVVFKALWFYMGVYPKIRGVSPQIIHFNRVWNHEINHPFWDTPISGNTHMFNKNHISIIDASLKCTPNQVAPKKVDTYGWWLKSGCTTCYLWNLMETWDIQLVQDFFDQKYMYQ